MKFKLIEFFKTIFKFGTNKKLNDWDHIIKQWDFSEVKKPIELYVDSKHAIDEIAQLDSQIRELKEHVASVNKLIAINERTQKFLDIAEAHELAMIKIRYQAVTVKEIGQQALIAKEITNFNQPPDLRCIVIGLVYAYYTLACQDMVKPNK